MHSVAVGGRQFLAERHRGTAAASVQQLPFGADQFSLVDHGQQRGDADAARDEQVPVGRNQREVVAGPADADQVTRREPLVHVRRAATPGRLAQDRDAVGVRVPPVTAQGVLAGRPFRQDQVDVRARSPVRQPRVVRVGESERDDAVGDRVFGADLQCHPGEGGLGKPEQAVCDHFVASRLWNAGRMLRAGAVSRRHSHSVRDEFRADVTRMSRHRRMTARSPVVMCCPGRARCRGRRSVRRGRPLGRSRRWAR